MAEVPEELFTKRWRKHHRKRYSLTEVRYGLLVLAALAAIAGWVVVKGRHPDPELFSTTQSLVRRAEVVEGPRPPAEGPKQGATAAPAGPRAERGPIPEALAAADWKEGAPSSFGPDNLYVKIDGREAYYKSFGFQKLYCLGLSDGSGRTIDLELYDLGQSQNALGAFAGEVPDGQHPSSGAGGQALLHRNALMLARGRYYLRAIGSDESEPLQAALRLIQQRFEATLAGEALPWAHQVFPKLGVDPSKVAYVAENAFSFGFAEQVYVGALADGDTELFAVLAKNPQEAAALAKRFNQGFVEYGRSVSGTGKVPWAADRYLERVSGAQSAGRFVAGVHSAADVKSAEALLPKLVQALGELPAEALHSATPPAKEGGGHE